MCLAYALTSLEPLPILVASAARRGRVVDPLYNALPALRAHGRGALYDGAARIEKCGGVLGGLSNGQLRERLAVTLPIFGGMLGRKLLGASRARAVRAVTLYLALHPRVSDAGEC